MEVETIKPQLFISSQCDRAGFQPYENDVVIVPASGRRLDMGCTTGNHALFMLCSFTNQVLAKLDLIKSVVLASSIQERCLPLAETAHCVSCVIAPSFIRSSAHRLRPTSTSTLWTT